MSEINEMIVGNPYANNATAEWQEQEAARLRDMDAVLAGVTEAALHGALHDISGAAAKVRMLDVGGGTGTTVEEVCEQLGVQYNIADINEEFLRERSTPVGQKVAALGEHLPFAVDTFGATHSRAAVAWSSDPKATLSEMIRVTSKDGGVMVVTDFDWSKAGATPESAARPQIMEVRAMFLGALTGQGFRPNYGAQSGADIDEVAQAAGIQYQRSEERFEFPPADYSGFLATTLEPMLVAMGEKNPALAAELKDRLVDIAAASATGGVRMRMPALVTQTVRLGVASVSA